MGIDYVLVTTIMNFTKYNVAYVDYSIQLCYFVLLNRMSINNVYYILHAIIFVMQCVSGND